MPKMMLSKSSALVYQPSTIFLLSSISLLCAFLPQSTAAPNPAQTLKNITIEVPIGTTNHSDNHLLCPPTRWFDFAGFFLANYVSHAATVKSEPGEPLIPGLLALVAALLLPTSGIIRGLSAAIQCAVSSSSPLETASKAGALCVVVRSPDWKPQHGDLIRGVRLEGIGRGRRRSQASSTREPNGVDMRPRSQASSSRQPNGAEMVLHDMGPADGQGRNEVHDGQTVGSQDSALAHPNPGHQQQNVQFLVVRDTLLVPEKPFKPVKDLLSLRGRKVHGKCVLPEGYELSLLPPGTRFRDMDGNEVFQSDGRRWWAKLWAWIQQRPKAMKAYFRRRLSTDSELETQGPHLTELSSSYSLSKGLVAIFQTVWASFTLWRTRGNQIDVYGYAAFGLTVAPYLVMSLVNLISTVLTPDYSVVYLVRTDIMEEAERREGHFDGVVGQIPFATDAYKEGDMDGHFEIQDGRTFMRVDREHAPTATDQPVDSADQAEVIEIDISALKSPLGSAVVVPSFFGVAGALGIKYFTTLLLVACGSIFLGLISLAIIGGISGFKEGHSTHAQRVWTMTWLAFGIALGPFYALERVLDRGEEEEGDDIEIAWLVYGAPAIGGFVVVAQMLNAYGRCIRIY